MLSTAALFRESRPLVELRLDLAVELAHGPAPAQGLGLVEATRSSLFHREQADVGGPGERKAGRDSLRVQGFGQDRRFSRRRLDYLGVG